MLLNDKVASASPARKSAGTDPTAATLTATLGLAAASWVVALRQMNGMDMGVATPLGSFAFFVALWVSMMAAMMLPGAAPAVLRRAQAGGVRAVPLFIGSYLAIWTLVGVAVYALYRPHDLFAAGAVVIAAGLSSSRRSSSTFAGGAATARARDSSTGCAASARASD